MNSTLHVGADGGLMLLWTQGDAVTRLVALLLLGMSVASWAVIVLKALDLARMRRLASRTPQFWDSPDLNAGLRALHDGPRTNPFHALAMAGQAAQAHLDSRDGKAHLRDSLDVSDWMARALQNAMDNGIAQLQSGLAVLASVGSTAPFIGLFGTVWGIYHALVAIGASGQSTIDQVAGPIGEALIMTALGLAVAIPAVLGYNALTRGNRTVFTQLKRFAHDLHALHVTGSRVRSSASAVAPQTRLDASGGAVQGPHAPQRA